MKASTIAYKEFDYITGKSTDKKAVSYKRSTKELQKEQIKKAKKDKKRIKYDAFSY